MDAEALLPTALAVNRGAVRLVRRLHFIRPDQRVAPMQMMVLFHLQRRGALSPSDLASADRIQPQSLTRTLVALEAEGWISREPDRSDGRRSVLAITKAGSEVLADIQRQRGAWLARTMQAELTPVECEVLRLAGELLERLADTPDLAVSDSDSDSGPGSGSVSGSDSGSGSDGARARS